MKEKVAFVVTAYGKQARGGAEQHCRMLAERLTADYEVDVLTTCVEEMIFLRVLKRRMALLLDVLKLNRFNRNCINIM